MQSLTTMVTLYKSISYFSIYKVESKLEQFYAALINGSFEREDTANMEEENVRNSHEIRQAFRNSSRCYDCYFLTVILGECHVSQSRGLKTCLVSPRHSVLDLITFRVIP